MMILLYIISILVVFFGFVFYNYKQTDRDKTTPAPIAWFAACFWPIILPVLLVVLLMIKGEKLFNNISKNDTKRKSN